MARMTDRELHRRALIDAYNWQNSLADANGIDTVAGKQAAHMASLYRGQLEKKFGMAAMPDDEVRRRRAGMQVLNVTDMMTGRVKVTGAGVMLPKRGGNA